MSVSVSVVVDDVESAAELSSLFAQPLSIRAAEIRRIKPKLRMFWIFMVFLKLDVKWVMVF